MGRMTALAAVISAAIAAIVMGSRNYGSPSSDEAVREAYSRLIESTPVLALILEDHPTLKWRLRAAIAADQESRPNAGLNRTHQLIAKIRLDHIVPTTLSADAAVLLRLTAAWREPLAYFQDVDPGQCRSYASAGFTPGIPSPSLAPILSRLQQAAADAYRSGRARRDQPAPMLTNEELIRALVEAGYSHEDFRKTRDVASLSDGEYCALMLRLFETPLILEREKGSRLVRSLLSLR